MMEITFSLSEINQVAESLVKQLDKPCCVAFHGEMGAGKTTMISAICLALGIKDNLSSPTFSIINVYNLPNGNPFYHIDLYRLKDANEAIGAGVEDCIYSGQYCFLEWPERAKALWPENIIHCFIESIDSNHRKLKLIL